MTSNGNDVDMEERQQLSLNTVGGYVDDLMERIRKMPPKKRSKFYQMLDEERLKDVNNNNQDDPIKLKTDEGGDDDDNEQQPTSMDVTIPLAVADVHSDDEDDRTLVEIAPKVSSIHVEDDDDNDAHHSHPRRRTEKKDDSKQPFLRLNDKNYEELLSMGVPLAVLKAIAFQQHQQTQAHRGTHAKSSSATSLTARCLGSSSKSASEKKNFLNARTILRKILQQHQKEQQRQSTNEKPAIETMDYTSDEEGDMIEEDDDDDDEDGGDGDGDGDEHPSSSSSMTPRHRNGIRSNSHNPATVVNANDLSSLSPPTSTSSSPDETDVNHHSSPNSISRPSSTPAALVSSGCSF